MINTATTTALYLNNQTYANAGDISSHDFTGLTTTIFWTTIIVISLGLIWITIVHCAPLKAPIIAATLAILALIAIGVLAFFIKNTYLFHYLAPSTEMLGNISRSQSLLFYLLLS